MVGDGVEGVGGVDLRVEVRFVFGEDEGVAGEGVGVGLVLLGVLVGRLV